MKVSYCVYDQQGEKLLAACDKHLLGETLKEGELHLNIKETFYGGDEIEIDDIVKHFKSSTIANLVGENTVNKAIEHGFGYEEDVLMIEGVPHLQIVRM
ncbi:MAG: DUF424 domain-containing protein [Candidatus Saliniplasma sp.]